jgi:hypothetical protein
MLIVGVAILAWIPLSNRIMTPRGTIWIWVPMNTGPSPDYLLRDVSARLSVQNDEKPSSARDSQVVLLRGVQAALTIVSSRLCVLFRA